MIFHTSLLSLFCDRLCPLCSFSSIKFCLPSTGVFSVFKCSRLHWKIFNVSVFATYEIHDTKLYILFWLGGFGYSRRNVRSFLPHVNNLLFVIVACTCHSLWKENKMTGNTICVNSYLLSIWDVKKKNRKCSRFNRLSCTALQKI